MIFKNQYEFNLLHLHNIEWPDAKICFKSQIYRPGLWQGICQSAQRCSSALPLTTGDSLSVNHVQVKEI